MLSDTVSRTIFWLWLASGLVPSVFVIVGSFAGLSIFAKQDSRHRAELERGEILVTHHAGITVGPIKLWVFPRLWAGIAATMGIVLLVFALVFLLHSPTRA